MNTDYTEVINVYMKKKQQKGDCDFLRFIGAESGKKCSVLSEYIVENSDVENEIINYAKENEISVDDYYYGLSPKYNEYKIISDILENTIKEYDDLKLIMDKNNKYFMLRKKLIDYIEPLYARTLLRVASRFGVKIEITKSLQSELEEAIKLNDKFVNNITYSFKSDEDNNKIFFCIRVGIPVGALEYLDNNNFRLIKSENGYSVSRNTSGDTKFSNILSDANISNISLLDGDVYYSGVLPRVRRIEMKNSFFNPSVQVIKLFVERTTFATVDSFDNCEINTHPLLNKWRDKLLEFERMEDITQNKIFEYDGKLGSSELITNLNQYLNDSFNTHILAVTGNIVLNKNALIFTQRSSNAIDGDTFYCSVNGQSEFKDYNVEMYKESVREDYPSLIADSTVRNDFDDELSRETKAELNIDLKSTWDYYGLSVLGISKRADTFTSKRRFHFNVLAYNECDAEFSTVLDGLDNATESFENQSIYLMKFNILNNKKELLKSFFYRTIIFIEDYSSIINHILALLLIIANPFTMKDTSATILGVFSNYYTLLLSIVIVLHFFLSKFKQIKSTQKANHQSLTVTHYTDDDIDVQLEKFTDNLQMKLAKKNNTHVNLHAVLIVMLSNFIVRKNKDK